MSSVTGPNIPPARDSVFLIDAGNSRSATSAPTLKDIFSNNFFSLASISLSNNALVKTSNTSTGTLPVSVPVATSEFTLFASFTKTANSTGNIVELGGSALSPGYFQPLSSNSYNSSALSVPSSGNVNRSFAYSAGLSTTFSTDPEAYGNTNGKNYKEISLTSSLVPTYSFTGLSVTTAAIKNFVEVNYAILASPAAATVPVAYSTASIKEVRGDRLETFRLCLNGDILDANANSKYCSVTASTRLDNASTYYSVVCTVGAPAAGESCLKMFINGTQVSSGMVIKKGHTATAYALTIFGRQSISPPADIGLRKIFIVSKKLTDNEIKQLHDIEIIRK